MNFMFGFHNLKSGELENVILYQFENKYSLFFMSTNKKPNFFQPKGKNKAFFFAIPPRKKFVSLCFFYNFCSVF